VVPDLWSNRGESTTSKSVRFMRIFAGFNWTDQRGDVNVRVGSSKTAIFASFGCYIFRTFTYKATVIVICIAQWLFTDTETDDLE